MRVGGVGDEEIGRCGIVRRTMEEVEGSVLCAVDGGETRKTRRKEGMEGSGVEWTEAVYINCNMPRASDYKTSYVCSWTQQNIQTAIPPPSRGR